MFKFFLVTALATLCVGTAMAETSDDCDCAAPPFVEYIISDEVELDENAWRVTAVTLTIDLTQPGEPLICVATLALFDQNDPLMFVDFQEVPTGDFETYYLGQWLLASSFELLMESTNCMTNGARG